MKYWKERTRRKNSKCKPNVELQKKRNGNYVVWVNKVLSYAPTYKEIREVVGYLIEIYGEAEVLSRLGLKKYLPHEEYDIRSGKRFPPTYFRGIRVIWDDYADLAIFYSLGQLWNYPGLYKHIVEARIDKDTNLVLLVDKEISKEWLVEETPNVLGELSKYPMLKIKIVQMEE